MKKLVSLLLAVALLFAHAMPAFAVDEVAPASAENVYILDAAEHLELMSGGTKTDGDTAVVGPDGYFTIHFSEKSKIDASIKVFDDGYEGTQRLNLQGKAQVDPNGITKNVVEFTTDGPGSVTIWWVLAGEERQMGIFDTEGNLVSQTETTLEKNQTCVSTLEIPTAGTYFIGGVTGNNYIFKLEVTVTAEDAPIAPAPTIADGKYVISWNGLTFSALAEDRVYGYPYAGDVNALTDADYITVTNVADGQFTMQDCYGRYIYLKGLYNSFNVSAEMPTEGYLWVLEEAEGGLLLKNVLKEKYIAYNEKYTSWGCYVDISASSILTVAGAAQGTPQESTTLPDLDCPLWWSAFTDGIEITESGVTITCVTTAYPEATNYWNGMNWLLYTANTPVVNGSGYAEYWMQRSDNYGWSTSLNVNCFSGADALAAQGVTYTSSFAEDFSWENFLAALQAGTKATVTARLEGTNAVVTTEVAGITSMVTMPVDTDKPVYLSLTGEQSTLTDIVVTTSEAEPAPAVLASGTCGENLTWTLTDDGTLTISGTGDMYHYESSSDVPWDDYRLQITTAIVEDGVTSIGKSAFEYCSSLETVIIGDSVTSIGNYAFSDCSSLKSVYITDIAAWCEIDFENEYSNPLYYDAALYLNGVLVTDLVIPDSATIIGAYSFNSCSSLESVTIPDSVISIGNDAFNSCSSLESVTIGDSVTSIDKCVFAFCSNLVSVTIGDGVTSIGNYAFEYCSSLETVIIGDSVTSIGNDAFYGCSSLVSITIPDSVTSIGKSAFYGCSSLWHVLYRGTRVDWNSISIGSSNWLTYATRHYECTGDEIVETNRQNATCTEDGEITHTCTICNETKTTTCPATGHTYASVVTAPTCAEQGFTTHTCAGCGDSYVDSYVDATGHNYAASVTAPTCTERGYTTYTCEACGDSYVDSYVAAIGHSYVDGACVRCGEAEPDFVYGDVNGDGKVDGRDLLKLKRYLANYDDETGTSTEEITAGADVNGDGKVDGRDLLKLKRYLANYDDETGTSTEPLGPQP